MSGDFADAFLSMAWYEALRGYPQNGAERLRGVRSEAMKRGAVVPFVDACRTLAMLYEILMQYGDGLEWLELAHKYARQIGDEPRRARVCGEMARSLAMKGRFEDAHERLEEGQAIAERLDLRVARMELWSAEGSVLVEERRGAEAVDPLERAITAMGQAGFRPALLRALLDAGYASYQTQDQALLDRVQDEIYDLADAYPGYSPLVALLMARLALWNGSAETAQRMAEEAKRVAEMYQNPGVAEEAGLLAPKGLGLGKQE
jgi:hypothetical protein